MPATYNPPADALAFVRVPAKVARYCAEHLANDAQEAERAGLTADAALLSIAGHAMSAAVDVTRDPLPAARLHLERCAALGDRLPTTTLHLPGELADALLVSRGWRIEPVPVGAHRPGGRVYVKPGRTPRSEGGTFGEDYLWEGPEALELALTAEALEVNR